MKSFAVGEIHLHFANVNKMLDENDHMVDLDAMVFRTKNDYIN